MGDRGEMSYLMALCCCTCKEKELSFSDVEVTENATHRSNLFLEYVSEKTPDFCDEDQTRSNSHLK